ncbi:HECT [Macleaya cordata]|uniref:HECT-type E3 ubiquitin transferase n=1 Tax=Macleaya cordata TaxID=56857 RepID=A0A200QUJ3_MACCD|nr:HECT [Macleaya cordata]
MAGLIKGHHQTKKALNDMVSSVYRRLGLIGGDSDEESSSSFSSSSSSSLREDIVGCVKEFLRMIPRDSRKKSMEHLQLFYIFSGSEALARLFNSPIKSYKDIGEESIRLFLKPEIGFLPTRYIQNQCALIVSHICLFLRVTSDDLYDEDEPLYSSCRETLEYLLKSIVFAKRSRYFGNFHPLQIIEIFFPFVRELSVKLLNGLYSIKTSESSTCLGLSFESDIREFAIFSLHMCRAIEDYVRSKGHSLPLCLDEKFDEHHPCYLFEIKWFGEFVFDDLLLEINRCMSRMKDNINKAKGAWEFNHEWSYYLYVLKELNTISKLYQGAEEKISSGLRSNQFSLDILFMYSKRSDDHQWLLKYKNVLDFETRRHLMVMTMFPEEEKEDHKKLHKMLIDRSQLLTESFEQIAHANPKSIHNGIFVEFKNEVATGHGVLREWLFLVCQELFNPQNPLFLACPHDRRRFFPNPAKVDPLHLNYFGFCGQVIALALMHEVQVGIAFDRVFFLQLSGERISLEDIRYADPCLYNSCKKILEMDADFMDSDAMGLTFVKEIEEFGSRKVVELCPGGNTLVVNSKNREEYVHLLIQQCFVKSISEKVSYFTRGFGDILCKRRLQKIFFQSLEHKDLDRMLLGSDKAICVKDWKAHTDYNDYKETDDQICWFWKVVEGMSLEQQRELLFFWTSVKYLPVNGFSGLPSRLYIYKTSVSHYHLPSSHTCYYRLSLPHYPSLAVMQQHLFLICQEHLGCSFGFL